MNRRETFAILIIVLLAFVARLLPGPRTIDDAYITFRYSRNLLAGNGFVYNPGEQVLGTTTPLYTLMMSAAAGLSGQRDPVSGLATGFPELALIINALADAISTLLLYRSAKRLSNGPLVGIGLAALWALNPISVTFAIGGMETSLFILLLLGTFSAYHEDRWGLTGALAALALLTRPEAVIAILLIVLDIFRRKLQTPNFNSNFLRTLLAFMLIITPWLIFATIYFGSPLPGSIAAKSSAYQLEPAQALITFLRTLVVPFSGVGDFNPLLGLLLIALYVALFIIGALGAIRRDARTWPIFAFVPIYIGAYIVANPLVFRWYVAPPLPMFLLGMALGWQTLARAFDRPFVEKTLVGGAAIIVVASALSGWWIPDPASTMPAPQMSYIKLELTYLEAAERLRGMLGKDSILAAGDIGALGYATNATLYDTLGLITPAARRYYPVPHEDLVAGLPYAIPTQLILDAQPDAIVIVEAYGSNTFLRDPEFNARYQLLDTLTSDALALYNSAGMLIFIKR